MIVGSVFCEKISQFKLGFLVLPRFLGLKQESTDSRIWEANAGFVSSTKIINNFKRTKVLLLPV